MKVYRIENPLDGAGPFRSRVLYKPYSANAKTRTIARFWNFIDKKFPNPAIEAEDAGEEINTRFHSVFPTPKGTRFGAVSRDALMAWVPSYAVKALAQLGFHERVYEVPDQWAVALPNEVIFLAAEAKLVEDKELI